MSANYLKKNKTLTNVYFQKSMDEPGIGAMIAPLLKTAELTGDYYEVERSKSDSHPAVDIRRAPGAETQRQERKGRELKSFRCVDHALIEEIPFELLEGTEEFRIVEEQMQAANDISLNIRTSHERDVYDLVWGANLAAFQAKLGGGFTPTTKWDNVAGTIKADVLTAKDSLLKASGKRANTLLITNEVFNKISTQDNEIRDVIKYTENGMVTAQKLARYFEVEDVIIPFFLVDSPTAGVSETKDFLWKGDNAVLFYVDKNSQSRKKTTFATTFQYDTPSRRWMQVYTGYNETTESEEVKVSAFWDVKKIDAACGYAIVDVLA